VFGLGVIARDQRVLLRTERLAVAGPKQPNYDQCGTNDRLSARSAVHARPWKPLRRVRSPGCVDPEDQLLLRVRLHAEHHDAAGIKPSKDSQLAILRAKGP